MGDLLPLTGPGTRRSGSPGHAWRGGSISLGRGSAKQGRAPSPRSPMAQCVTSSIRGQKRSRAEGYAILLGRLVFHPLAALGCVDDPAIASVEANVPGAPNDIPRLHSSPRNLPQVLSKLAGRARDGAASPTPGGMHQPGAVEAAGTGTPVAVGLAELPAGEVNRPQRGGIAVGRGSTAGWRWGHTGPWG